MIDSDDGSPSMDETIPTHTPPVFTDRSPENLERYFDLVEGFEKHDLDFHEETGKSADPLEPGRHVVRRARSRTAHRLKYEAQVDVIKRQVGDLEDIRQKLGLSRRKMCQLLMVDPSAWTRWMKEGAPPSVYRALEWYVLLQKESPHQAHSYWLATVGGRGTSETELINGRALNDQVAQLARDIQAFRLQNQKLRHWSTLGALFFAVTLGLVILSMVTR